MDFPNRLLSLRNKMGLTQEEMADRLGLKGNYISILERGGKVPSEAVQRHVELIERAYDIGLYGDRPVVRLKDEDSNAYQIRKDRADRRIPVVSWAHAGTAVAYDELPLDWQHWVPTDCPDPNAFGVELEGDSMKGIANDGDLLVVQPSREPHSGCLAVVRLATDGVVFRRVELRRDKVLLIPSNPAYERESVDRSEVSWIYPTWGGWSQHWKKTAI